MVDLERTDNGRVSGNAVKTKVSVAIGDVSEEIGVRAVASEWLLPRRPPRIHPSAFHGGFEGRRVRLSVVVIVNGKCTEVVTAVRERNGVAVLFARR